MADQATPQNVPLGIKFEKVEQNHQISGGSNRSEAALVVRPTGYVRSNTELKDQVIEMIDGTDISRERFRFSFGVNKELGVIALYLAKWEDKGAMPVRVTPHGLTFHLGGVFYQYPSLRPNTIIETETTIATDAEGHQYVGFNVLSALPKSKTRKRRGSTTANSGTAVQPIGTVSPASGSATPPTGSATQATGSTTQPSSSDSQGTTTAAQVSGSAQSAGTSAK